MAQYVFVKRDDLYDLVHRKNNYVESSLANKPPAFFDMGVNPDWDYDDFGESEAEYVWDRKEVDYILVRVSIYGGGVEGKTFYYGTTFEPHIDHMTVKECVQKTLPYFFESVKNIDNL